MVGWFGPGFGKFGYAVHNRKIVCAMLDRGVKVAFAPSMYPVPPLDPDEEKLAEHVVGYRGMGKDLIVVHCIPANPLPRGVGYIICYTTVESIEAHPNVCARLRLYDEVWVPSRFSKWSIVKGGLTTKRIEVVPEGVDPEFWTPNGNRPALCHGDEMVLGYHGDWSTRKGVHELVAVASRVCSSARPIRLVFWVNKGRERSEKTRQEIWGEILQFCPDGSVPAGLEVELDLREKTNREVRDLYRRCHYYVHLGRGEAWNLTLCAAASTGTPTIALAACGESEFMVKRKYLRVKTDGTMYLTEMGPVAVGHHNGVRFWRIDVEHLASVLRSAVSVYSQQVEKARWLSGYIRKHVTWDVAAAHAIRRLRRVARETGYPGPYDVPSVQGRRLREDERRGRVRVDADTGAADRGRVVRA